MLQLPDIRAIQTFLLCDTPLAWQEKALAKLDVLLIDHAWCELKAASQAMSLIGRYSQYPALVKILSPLAREELLHFEKVNQLLNKRGIALRPLPCSDYAKTMHQLKHSSEPDKLLDTLIIAAIIEARSCERFHALIPHLDEELQAFYVSLVRSEARHFEMYIDFAKTLTEPFAVEERMGVFLEAEKTYIESEDSVFCFHSGI